MQYLDLFLQHSHETIEIYIGNNWNTWNMGLQHVWKAQKHLKHNITVRPWPTWWATGGAYSLDEACLHARRPTERRRCRILGGAVGWGRGGSAACFDLTGLGERATWWATWCLEWQNKMALSNIPLPWAYFIFLFLFFLSLELDHHHMSTIITMDFILLQHLALDHPNLSTHLSQGLV
jgi:hypothetical protein